MYAALWDFYDITGVENVPPGYEVCVTDGGLHGPNRVANGAMHLPYHLVVTFLAGVRVASYHCDV